MFAFTDAERAYFQETRAIAKDERRREVLVGLTYEETGFYLAYSREFGQQRRSRADRQVYLRMHDRHERMRLDVACTEISLRKEHPWHH
jgi:hypothetical protein